MKEITFIIKPDGTVEIEASGYSGRECTEDTEAFEEVLGEVTDRKKKPEMYQRAGASRRLSTGR